MWKKCLHCERWARTRGCCLRCYQQRLNRVTAGEATWPELEEAGEVMPNRVLASRQYLWRRFHGERKVS